MPIKMHTGAGLHVNWNEWLFYDSYMVRMPEEGVARDVSNQKHNFSVSLFR